MKALLLKASDYDYQEKIEVNTIEDLLKIDKSLIIESDEETLDIFKNSDSDDFEMVITIYDDYIE
jgi:hypothetical protein